MNKVLLSICVLLIAQTSFAGHHEKSEQATKTIIGYEILDGERLEIVAGKSSNVDIWVKYVEAHTGKNDEDSVGNSIADQLASQALKEYSNKFEQFNTFNFKTNTDLKTNKVNKSKPGDISKYFL